MNQPSIERHQPLLDGIHGLYYDPESGFLTAAIEQALADKDRLRTIARAGKAHVLAHHTVTAIAQIRGRDHARRTVRGELLGTDPGGCGSNRAGYTYDRSVSYPPVALIKRSSNDFGELIARATARRDLTVRSRD